MPTFTRIAVVAALTVAGAVPLEAQAPAPDPQGKIISMQGQVQHAQPRQDTWDPAKVFQPLFVSERVRTLVASRAAILFIDESQVKLNAGAVLTVQQIRQAGGTKTTLELEKGEGWFRTKNPQSGLTIKTPAAAAAIRGTEINLVVQPDNQTVLTVVEGSVEFSNDQGAILVNAGEEGTARPGQAPTKRVILNPEDAVQWALYYPAEVEPSDAPRTPPTGAAAEAESHAQRAADHLKVGEVAAARTEIDAALSADPAALRPLVLLSGLELRRNRPDEAMQAAERALAAHQQSVGALVAASEASQARFDLRGAERYLDRALAVDPKSVHALVDRARLRFGTDRTAGAKADAALAASLAPGDAQVRSLRGFIELADGDTAAARTDFEASAQADTELGEPHLGLGLVNFRDGREDEGLLEMLTATLLEPKVSLYQSYLGKAYYQAHRFPEGLAALATAERLDPRDPTPWLYSSFFLRDQNRQVDALDSLRHAIALNDYRAVYRSRLLLDRDLATKNVSLAQIYRQLGFEGWGGYEAINSLETDLTNASAHLFMAETYGRLPDRVQAQGSELLQYFLYAPVNRNSFNNFSEYTALLEQPRKQIDAEAWTGSRALAYGSVTSRSGNDRFAHVAFYEQQGKDSNRTDERDNKHQAFFQGKLALGAKSDVFLNLDDVHNDSGADLEDTRIFGLEAGTPVIVRQFTTTPNTRVLRRFTDNQATVGFTQRWSAGSSLTTTIRYDNLEQREQDPHSPTSTCKGFDLSQAGFESSSELRNPYESLDWQIQQATRVGRRHQVIVGEQVYSLSKKNDCSETISVTGSGAFVGTLSYTQSADDLARVTYARDEVQVTDWLHVSAGVEHQHVEYADFTSSKKFEFGQWNPLAGASVRLAPRTVLRAAAFRNVNTNFVGSRISPPTLSGFVIERNEFPTTRRKEFDLSVEHGAGRAFVGVRTFVRDTEVPFLLASGTSFFPEANSRTTGATAYVNWIAASRISVFADDQLSRLGASMLDRYDNLARVGVNLIHPSGLFVRVTGSYLTQRFVNTAIQDLPRSGFGLIDVQITKEFAGKRGLLDLTATNLFDEQFNAVIEGLSVDPLEPSRRVVASLRWRVW